MPRGDSPGCPVVPLGFPQVLPCWRVPAPDGGALLGRLTCLGFN